MPNFPSSGEAFQELPDKPQRAKPTQNAAAASSAMPTFTAKQISDLVNSQIQDGSTLDAIVERFAAHSSDPKAQRLCLLAMLVEPAMSCGGMLEIAKVCRFFRTIGDMPFFGDGFDFPRADTESQKFWASIVLQAAARLPLNVLTDLAMAEAATEGAADRIAEKKKALQFSLTDGETITPEQAKRFVDGQKAAGVKGL